MREKSELTTASLIVPDASIVIDVVVSSWQTKLSDPVLTIVQLSNWSTGTTVCGDAEGATGITQSLT
jgi:hypothetical protein